MNRVLAAIVIFMASLAPAHAGPRAECAEAGAALPCLDARLKEANQRLNATLKAAQERLEQIQARGGRPMLGAFIDSQRKFNAYRDAQCSWQAVRAAPGENSAEYVRECQLEVTLAREADLAAFAAGEQEDATPAVAPEAPEVAASEPAPQADTAAAESPGTAAPSPAPTPAPAAAGQTSEWHLVNWVAGGKPRALVPDSAITIAFDPSGKVSGKASVNRFSGTYRFDADGRLVWPAAGFAATKMAGSPALMAQEREFLAALRRTSRYRVEGQTLVLESPNASVVLSFAR